jgi:hypothetical protein
MAELPPLYSTPSHCAATLRGFVTVRSKRINIPPPLRYRLSLRHSRCSAMRRCCYQVLLRGVNAQVAE